MSKHTEGPWEVRADWIVGFNGTLHVATIPRAFDGDYSEANALLIAAAPDLLQELQNIANADYRHWEDGYNTAEEFVLWAKSRARHAIAKIEGVKP